MKSVLHSLGSAGQWTGMLAVTIGLFWEAQTGAQAGFIAISAGSIIFALFTKYKHEVKG